MKHTVAAYINVGRKHEQTSLDKAQAVAEKIRKMLMQERLCDQPTDQYLVERGRQEARQKAAA